MSKFSELVTAILDEKEINPYTVATWVGERTDGKVSAQFIYEWKNGSKEPASAKYIRWFADALKVPRLPLFLALSDKNEIEPTDDDIEWDRKHYSEEELPAQFLRRKADLEAKGYTFYKAEDAPEPLRSDLLKHGVSIYALPPNSEKEEPSE